MKTVALWRFDEPASTTRPRDEVGNVADMGIEASIAALPDVVDGVTGRARAFLPSGLRGMRAQDIVPGSTLLTRDVSIQAIMSWSLSLQNAHGKPGTMYARGRTTTTPELISAGLELRVVNVAANIGELRWFWQDAAGFLRTQTGGQFIAQGAGYLLLTATRRWIDSTHVAIRYYIGDQLMADTISADGDIAGGTTGTTQIGARFVSAAFDRFLAGNIDELRVVDYELTAEEIAATYRRITYHQVRGYQLVREAHPLGFPISSDPGSRVQRETRLWGQVMGFAAAQADNVRDNALPDRAYGPKLEQWEGITKQPPRPGDSTEARRARVVSSIRNKAGVSIPGINTVISEVIATAVSNLEIMAFDQGFFDSMVGFSAERWHADPGAGTSWTSGGGARALAGAATDIRFLGHTASPWMTVRTGIAAMPLFVSGLGAHLLAKVTPALLPTSGEVGVYFADRVRNNFFLLGLRNNAGVFQIVTETFVAGVSSGAVVQAVSSLVPHWLHIFHQAKPHLETLTGITARWSTTSGTAGFSQVADLAFPAGFQWCGMYARGTAAALGGGGLDATFSGVLHRCPFGDRSLRFYVYRNPTLPGVPDLLAAHNLLQGIKQSHTQGTVITSKSILCDDPTTGCDRGPMGGF